MFFKKKTFSEDNLESVIAACIDHNSQAQRTLVKLFLGYSKSICSRYSSNEQEVEEIIQKEHERVFPLIAKIRLKLEGKRAFVNGGTGRSFAAAALINDFGMKLVGLETPTYDDDAQEDINYLNELNGDFILHIANMQPYEQVNIVKRLKPDVCIGIAEWISRLGIPTTDLLGYNKPTMGYDGIIYLGNKICDQIENPSFNKKLAKYDKLPYKDTWYDEDPFKYIVMKEG